MLMLGVRSSNISAVGHDADTLAVRFHHGGVYLYEGVPYDIFTRMLKDESPGRFLAREIKGRYNFRKSEPPPESAP